MVSPSQASNSGSIVPQHGDRSVVIGHTGSGKSEFLKWLIERTETTPIVIYDTKPEPSYLELPGAALAKTWEQVLQMSEDGETDYIVFRPPADELFDASVLDEYLWRHLQELPNVTAVIDELYAFHNHGRAGKGLSALLTQGRVKGNSVIMATQRPAFISLFSLTEAQNFYVYRLLHKKDLVRVSDIIADYDRAPELPDFGFYYYSVRTRILQAMNPIDIAPKALAKKPEKENTRQLIATRGHGTRWI